MGSGKNTILNYLLSNFYLIFVLVLIMKDIIRTFSNSILNVDLAEIFTEFSTPDTNPLEVPGNRKDVGLKIDVH